MFQDILGYQDGLLAETQQELSALKEKLALYAELYLDTGLGFNPHQVLRQVIFTDQQVIEFDLSNYRGIRQCRFDPINAPAAIQLKAIRLIEEDGTPHEVEDFESNTHCRKDGTLIFGTADPQIIFPTKAMERPCRLIVQLTYNAVGQEVFQDILGYQDGLLTDTRSRACSAQGGNVQP